MRLLIHVGVISVNHIPVGSEGACKRAELTRIHEHYLVYVHVLTCYENAWTKERCEHTRKRKIHVELAHPNYNCLETVVLFSQGEYYSHKEN